jgi:hypothetical protein
LRDGRPKFLEKDSRFPELDEIFAEKALKTEDTAIVGSPP